jgi:hypothetical protein
MQPPQKPSHPSHPFGTPPLPPGQLPPVSSSDFPTQASNKSPQYPTWGQPHQQGAQGSVWQRFNAWLATRSNGQRVGIGLGAGFSALLVVCVMCSCIAAALGNGGTSSNGTNNVRAVVSTHTTDMSQRQATALATATATDIPATPTPLPTATATPKPKPKPTCIPGAVNCNPWGYNFSHGSVIYNPPYNFCDYFNCIPSFWSSTNGYVEECLDKTYSHSGGRSGSCSHHGGNWRALLKP